MASSKGPKLSIANMLARRVRITPERAALRFEGVTQNFGALEDRVLRIAAALGAGGAKVGDRIGYLGLNHAALLECLFAASALGAIFVPLNFRLTADELTFIVNDAGLHTLIVDDDLAPVIAPARAALRCKRYIRAETAADGDESLSALAAAHAPLAAPADPQEDDVAVIMYTSGTTGRPKGAMLTNGNMYWNTVNLLYAAAVSEMDVTLAVAPLFHIAGLNGTTLGTLISGGLIVVHRKFEAAAVLRAIEEDRITTLFCAPAMLRMMSLDPSFAKTDLSGIRLVLTGAAPIPETLVKTYVDRGVCIRPGYGMTETAPLSTMCSLDTPRDKLNSVGRPVLLCDIAVKDANGAILGPGEKGEICMRGPNVMKGYWNRPEATAEAIDGDGWMHSGDVGHIDGDGYVYVYDRVKDMVITGGENVYPAEVEGVMLEHPAIADACIIGLPDEKWGEAVTAVVALKAGESLTLEDLRAFAEKRLARYKLPLRLHFLDALPRNPAGKVLKYQLRETLK